MHQNQARCGMHQAFLDQLAYYSPSFCRRKRSPAHQCKSRRYKKTMQVGINIMIHFSLDQAMNSITHSQVITHRTENQPKGVANRLLPPGVHILVLTYFERFRSANLIVNIRVLHCYLPLRAAEYVRLTGVPSSKSIVSHSSPKSFSVSWSSSTITFLTFTNSKSLATPFGRELQTDSCYFRG